MSILGFFTDTAEHPDAYYLALGRFLGTYATIEAAMHLVLWHYAKTRHHIAQAVLSGFKIDQEIDLIKRLVEARRLAPNVKADLDNILGQLRVINKARNDILHHGVSYMDGQTVVSNYLLAMNSDRLKEFPISSKHLNEMQDDCLAILVRLHQRHMPRRSRLKMNKALRHFLSAPWQYKHELIARPKSQKLSDEDRLRLAQAHPARRKSSRRGRPQARNKYKRGTA